MKPLLAPLLNPYLYHSSVSPNFSLCALAVLSLTASHFSYFLLEKSQLFRGQRFLDSRRVSDYSSPNGWNMMAVEGSGYLAALDQCSDR